MPPRLHAYSAPLLYSIFIDTMCQHTHPQATCNALNSSQSYSLLLLHPPTSPPPQDEFNYDDTSGHAVLGRPPNSPVPPKRILKDTISFKRVALDAPDGMPLVRVLSVERMGVGTKECHTLLSVHVRGCVKGWACMPSAASVTPGIPTQWPVTAR